MTDPATVAEWRDAVNLAKFWLLVDSARAYGLVSDGPVVDVARCEQILANGRRLGYLPLDTPDLVERYL